MNRLTVIALLASLFSHLAFALPPTPAEPQTNPVAITGVTVHVGNGTIIEAATVTFAKGIITGVHTGEVDLTSYTVLDRQGQHLYPGIVLPNSRLGLTEVNNVRGTRDDVERGALNASVRTLVAYNTDSELTATLRYNGVLTAQISPRGGLLAGLSSIVQLDAWNWQDAALKTDDAMHIYWPKPELGKPDYFRQVMNYEPNKNYQTEISRLTELFDAAKADRDDSNLKLAAVKRVLAGDTKLFIHADSARQMMDAIEFAETVPDVVLVGAREALLVKDRILEVNWPIIIEHLHGLPATVDTAIDENFSRPARFLEAGFNIGLGAKIRQEPSSDRNLAFIAGTTVAYGLDKESALSLITYRNAQILGIADELGSIEVGKRATLFVSKGDALDMRTNKLTATFIDGRSVQIEGMQQELHKRFKQKYTR